jgi:uncharacterized protein
MIHSSLRFKNHERVEWMSIPVNPSALHRVAVLFACLVVIATYAAPPTRDIHTGLIFRGFLIEGAQLFAHFSDRSGATAAKWLAPGDRYMGYGFKGLSKERTGAVMERDGTVFEIPLEVSPAELAVSAERPAEAPQDIKLNAEAVERLFMQLQLDQMIERTMRKQREVLGMQLDKLKQATGQKKEVSDAIDQALSWEAIKGDLIHVYSNNYTAEELRGISEFYSSPVGKALLAKQEKVSSDTIMVLQRRIQLATSAIDNSTN